MLLDAIFNAVSAAFVTSDTPISEFPCIALTESNWPTITPTSRVVPRDQSPGLFVLPYIVFHKAFKYGRQGFRHDFDVLNGKHLAFIQFDRTHQVVDFPLNIQLILLTIPGVELTDRQGHSQ